MTLDYKILGQLYYGPEINETPEIPGTSGYYTSTTVGITNGFVAAGSNAAAYSTDGITWTVTTMPGSDDWSSITYGNGKFVAVNPYTAAAAYSTDGINWTASTLPSNSYWASVTYGDGKFVAVASQDGYSAYSTDGITWTASTLPSSANWASVTYGDGKFVVVATNSTAAAYSTDGITWTASTLPSSANWASVTYGDGKFVVAAGSNAAAYSTDGITWTASTLPNIGYWRSITAGQVSTLVEVQISIGGQGTPGSYVEITEPQVLYTVPAGTETTVTSIYVTNHDSIQRTYDLAVVPEGETLGLKHHIRWDMPVGSSDFDLTTAKLTLSAGDKIYVFPSTINKVGFTAFGVEKS